MSTKSSLLPREHGAYAELAFPLVTGLTLVRPSLWALTLGAAAVAMFLVNEPVAILLGVRGQRLRTQRGDDARTRVLILLSAAAILAGVSFWGGGALLWPWILFPFLASLILVPMVLAGKQKTLVGEFLVVTAFSTLLLPLSAASGADPWRAASAALVWWISLALGTLEVHAIKARHKEKAKNPWTRWASPILGGLFVAGALALALGFLRVNPAPFLAGSAVAVLPPAVAVLVVSLLRVHPRNLKRVGWTLVGANTLTLILLLIG